MKVDATLKPELKDAFDKIERSSLEKCSRLLSDQVPLVMVGTATCGRSAGSMKVLDAFRSEVDKHALDAEVIEVGCMGHCYAEPMAVIARPGYPPIVYHRLNEIMAASLTRDFVGGEDPKFDFMLGALEANEMIPSMTDMPRYGMEMRRLLDRAGRVDPWNIHHAVALGAYGLLPQALSTDPDAVIEEVKRSGLRGLGGAGFPAGRKWALSRTFGDSERYLICNADEGDPGAFMDRSILESDPHAVIEGMIIAAHAVGVSKGFVYVRAEYPLAVRILANALDQARELGMLGADILGSGLDFDIEIVKGAGAFVCGESSALMYSIEGSRGMPRVRPPRSVQEGLFGKPTVLNNVKTFASVPILLREGADRFASIGTEGSKGTAVFALAGKIANTGLVEVPMGTSLRELIFNIGGGVPKKKKFKAVQIGGPSGGCLPEETLDIPIDFDALADAGAMMGSGGMVVLDQDNCMVETARFFLEFTQRESCGKCTFCRIGTKHMLDILTEIVEGRGQLEDLDRLVRLAEDIQKGSLCSLGKTAPNPVLTTLRYFRDEYEAHINEKRCPACECKALTAYYILPDRCVRSCDACVGSCPTEAIFMNKKRLKVIDQNDCVKCDSCMTACPPEYLAVVKISPLSDLPPQEPRPPEEE